ncbi:hypothetical protein [Streptomyces sp. NBC_01361]|uniref:hypothetical protein n=1 Tax=Streptomyces sp. NBC_01361 TaxID=2903838 RepID=UPI002E338E78|nr:hypothetical protein [Streptomyces sp. NBC_01361]
MAARDFAEAAALATKAARHALSAAGRAPGGIGGLITLHDTGAGRFGSEALALHLIDTLGLPARVSCAPLAPQSSAGGLHALELARDLARPGKPVLVVGSEIHNDGQPTSNIPLSRQLLLADGAAAVVVSTEPPEQGQSALRLSDFWTWTAPGDHTGQLPATYEESAHFNTPEDAAKAVREAVARLPWAQNGELSADFVFVHPGGPHYLQAASEGPLGGTSLQLSWDTLSQDGDTGATAILRVLGRAYDTPPPHGATGILVSISPMQSVALRAHWHKDG